MTPRRDLGALTDVEWWDLLDEFVALVLARQDAFGLDEVSLVRLFDSMTAEREKARRAYLVARSKWAS